MGAGAIGGLAAAGMTKDPESTLAKSAPYIVAASALPNLTEEARASFKGISGLKKLRKLTGANTLKGARKSLALAFLTHAAKPLAYGIGSEAIRRFRVKQMKKVKSHQRQINGKLITIKEHDRK